MWPWNKPDECVCHMCGTVCSGKDVKETSHLHIRMPHAPRPEHVAVLCVDCLMDATMRAALTDIAMQTGAGAEVSLPDTRRDGIYITVETHPN